MVGGTHGAQLSFRHRSKQAPPHIVGQADAPDDAVDPVSVGHSIFGAFKQEQSRTFADNESVARSIKR